MAVSVVIPAAKATRVKCGKIEQVGDNMAALQEWADRQLPDDQKTFAIALSIILSKLRPGKRGVTLNVDLGAATNLVWLGQ